MDLENIMLSEKNQTEKSQEPHDFVHLWDMKLKTTNKKNKQKLTDTDNSIVVTSGKEAGG